jgi:hypothetical protein
MLADRSADSFRSGERAAAQTALALRQPEALCTDSPSKAALQQLEVAGETTLGALPPARLRALWIERNWLRCAPRSAQVRDRLDLYAVIAANDSRRMFERSRALLEGPASGGGDWGRFLLSAAILGAKTAGEFAQADELWKKYARTFYPFGEIPPYVVYLDNLDNIPIK